MLERLKHLFGDRLIIPSTSNEIPNKGYMVYILVHNGTPIVLGHGQKNRAKVIFDDENIITTSHLKALFVRLYNLYGKGEFERYLLICKNKDDAKEVERNLHQEIGGNTRKIPDEIRKKLFLGLAPNSTEYLLIEIALRSSFDGLSDLKKWRSDGIVNDNVWFEIAERLKL
jgi:hypothetical protein